LKGKAARIKRADREVAAAPEAASQPAAAKA
jgi:hypothetical protein